MTSRLQPIVPEQAFKIISRAGHLFFVIYFIYAWIFYIERSIPYDAAFCLFKMIHSNSFNFEHGRWGEFYTQLLPLAGLWLGCSLKTFLLLYSLSFAIWNYIFFLVLLCIFKRPYIALAFVLSLTLFCRYSFYFPVSEVHTSLGPLFIFLALLDQLTEASPFGFRRQWPLMLLLVLATVWIARIHLLAIFPLGFMIVYAGLQISDKKSRITYALIALACLSLFMLFILMLPKDSYQGSRMLSPDSIRAVIKDMHHDSYYFFLHELNYNYTFTAFLCMALLGVLIYTRNFLKGVLLLCSLGGFWLVLMAYYSSVDSPLNYQNYYCYFGVFMAIPFSAELLRRLPGYFFISILLLIMGHDYYKIFKSGLRFTDRTAYLQRTAGNLRHYPGSKFLVSPDNLNQDILWGTWDLGFESLFVSSIASPDSTVTFYGELPDKASEEASRTDKNVFLGASFTPTWFSVRNVNSHPDFFRLNNCLYKNVTTIQDKNFADSLFTKETMDIILKPAYTLVRNEVRILPVVVQNKTGERFCSTPTNEKKLRLSYHLYDKNMNPVQAEGLRSIIEMDIEPGSSVETGLALDLKGVARGSYILEVDMIHENKRWFRINKKTALTLY